MRINKKIAQVLLAAGLATSTLATACKAESSEFISTEVPIESFIDEEDFETINKEFKIEKEQEEVIVEEQEENPEDKYKFNAVLEEYEDGSKLVHVDGEDIIIFDDVVVKYDENGVAYLEQAPLSYQYEKRGIKRVFEVEATTAVMVRTSSNTEAEPIGQIGVGQHFELIDYLDNGWYRINYYGEEGFVCGDYVKEIVTYDFTSSINKIFTSTADKVLSIPGYLREVDADEEVVVPKGELFEVYIEDDREDTYLVKTSDYVGYITKEDLLELTGTIVVVDQSDQNLKIYKDNEIVMNVPVVTGKPSTPTNNGLFEVAKETFNRDLVGPTWRSYVNVMMSFDGGIGLHDAEYHTDDDGKKHGWKAYHEFGGDYHFIYGSHGCVNMRHNDAIKASTDYVDVGTKVLVKK